MTLSSCVVVWPVTLVSSVTFRSMNVPVIPANMAPLAATGSDDSSVAVRLEPAVSVHIPREQFPRSILVANGTRMSLTCYEDVSDVL